MPASAARSPAALPPALPPLSPNLPQPAVLNLFGGILSQKRRSEVALEESGIPYLILRPGGLERAVAGPRPQLRLG